MGFDNVSSLTSNVYRCVIAATLMLGCSIGYSQTQSGSATAQSSADQQAKLQSQANNQAQLTAAKPYQLSSRLHLQAGTNRGYLVVRVDLAKGSHIYSLTQKGDVRPTTLTVTKSNQFRLLGKFAPDRAAEVTKHDPVFKQQVEKHKNQVQFFIPIELAPGAELAKLSPEVSISGQVCTNQNVCMPILGETVKGKFAGYFERTAKSPNASGAARDSSSTSPNRQYR